MEYEVDGSVVILKTEIELSDMQRIRKLEARVSLLENRISCLERSRNTATRVAESGGEFDIDVDELSPIGKGMAAELQGRIERWSGELAARMNEDSMYRLESVDLPLWCRSMAQRRSREQCGITGKLEYVSIAEARRLEKSLTPLLAHEIETYIEEIVCKRGVPKSYRLGVRRKR